VWLKLILLVFSKAPYRAKLYSMRFLVTGGAGFIGSHLVRRLLHHGPVTVLDNLSSGNRKNLANLKYNWIEGSILDPHLLAQSLVGATHVFHLAAMVSVPESVKNPSECQRINIEGTRQLLQAATTAGAQRLVLASSCAIYGNEPTMPKVETLPPAPASPYAESKLAGEKLCSTSPLSAVSLRFFNVYGPNQDPRGPYAAAVPRFLEAALAGTALTLHGDGLQTRDFVFVDDVTSALIHVAFHPELQGVFNVASGQSTSILQLAQAILALTRSSSPITHTSARPADVRFSSASIQRINATGWYPKFSLSQGLPHLLPKN
jgi:UDP-glucose 4-epimerase